MTDPALAHVTLRATGKRLGAQWLEGWVPQLLTEAVAAAAAQCPSTGDEALTTVEVTLPMNGRR